MKLYSINSAFFLILLAVLSLCLPREVLAGTNSSNQCNSVSDSVIFYEHPYFSGDTAVARGTLGWTDLRERQRGFSEDWNDAISSIEIPDGYRVTLYKNNYYGGPSLTLTSSVRQLFEGSQGDWDNIASSVRVEFTGSCQDTPMAIFYDQPFFRGRSFVLYAGEARKRLHDKRRGTTGNWNDRIESVKIVGDFSVTLYDNDRYRGSRVTLFQSAQDLDVVGSGWVNRASSVRLSRAN